MPYNSLDEASAVPAPTISVGAPLVSVGETLESMRGELYYQLGGRDDIDPNRLTKWLNWAYLDLWTSLEIDEAKGSMVLELQEGQPVYVLPYQVSTILEAAIEPSGSSQRGKLLSKIDLRAYRKMPDVVGEPEQYFRHGNLLVVYPTPVTARRLFLDFRSRPLPLVEETDSPALPVEWHEAILLNARKKGFSSIMEFDKALPAENDFVNTVRRRQDREANEDEGRVIQSAVPRHGYMLTRKRGRLSAEPE